MYNRIKCPFIHLNLDKRNINHKALYELFKFYINMENQFLLEKIGMIFFISLFIMLTLFYLIKLLINKKNVIQTLDIYERFYDNPYNREGKEKPNKYLGKFKIIEKLQEDTYTSMLIGEKNGVIFLIEEKEVSGINGGSRFIVTELKTLKMR